MPIQTIRLPCLLLLTSTLTLGCAQSSDIALDEFFNTNITAENAKLFQFYLVKNTENLQNEKEKSPRQNTREKKDRKGQQKSQDASHMNNSNNISEKVQQVLLERLSDKLAANQYCREGYIELETNVGRGLASIKGECHESATPEDRKRFPNNK